MANENNQNWMSMLALGLAVFAIVLIVAKGGTQEFVLQQSETNTLSVSGNAEMMFDPDKADVYVRIETREDDAQEAQEENRLISSDVMAALEKAGVDEEDVETSQYRLDRVEEYNRESRETEFEGYRLVNVLKVTTQDLDAVGNIIDASVEAGANGVDRVEFGLSDSKMRDARDQALEKASQLARDKAESMADHLGVNLGRPSRITESQYDFVPYRVAEESVMMAADAGAPGTKVSPQKVEIRARVGVDYKIS